MCFFSVSSFAKPSKPEKFTISAPSFVPRLQEPECAPAAASGAEPVEAEEFNPFLSCGTCFVPMLDLSPDVHGTSVNTFGSVGAVTAPAAEQAPAAMLRPVLLKPSAMEDASQRPAPQPTEFRQLVDCPTCFVPSTDLSYVGVIAFAV